MDITFSFLTKRVIAFQAVKLQDDPTSVYCHHLPLRTGGPGHKVSVATRTWRWGCNNNIARRELHSESLEPEEVGAVVGRRALVLGGPVATASLQQDIGDQETISSWKRDFESL